MRQVISAHIFGDSMPKKFQRNLAAVAFLGVCLLGGAAWTQGTIVSPSYGPLTFNKADGGDLYLAQAGHFTVATLSNGVMEFHLKGEAFQIGYSGRQANICLTQVEAPEIRTSPSGSRASC